MPDPWSAHYRDLLAGSHDGVDRIVRNAYFGLGMSPGEFRYGWPPRTAPRSRWITSTGCGWKGA